MARKRGRKPLGKEGSAHFNTRIDPSIKRQIEKDAKKRGRTISREIQERLRASVVVPRTPTSRRAAEVAYIAGQIAAILQAADREEGSKPFNWRENPFDLAALKAAFAATLDQFGPSTEPGPSRYTLFDTTPADAGRQIAAIVGYLLRELNQIDEPSDSFWLTFPRIAEEWGIRGKVRQTDLDS